MAKNEAKIKFTAETGEFNKSIQNANREMTELRAELKLNETQMKSTGASVEALEKKHSILQNQLSASENKTEALNQKVKKAVEIFGENSQEASKLRVQLLNAETAEEKLRQSVAKCADELAELKGESADSRNAFEKLNDTIEEQKTELDQLKQEYSNAVLEHGKLSKEARTLAKEIKSVSSDLDANQKAMSRLDDAADKLDNSLEQVDETAEKVSEGFTVMKGAMADLVADGIEAVISGFSEIASSAFLLTNDIDKATNDFIARTGESTENAEQFEDAMVNIYNGNYGESFEDIADSMATVKTAMGDIGSDELEKLTTDAIVLRDTFDMDVNESIRAVNSMMDQFGITADEAYSLIAQGAQSGLNQNGDLLDIVNEYSVQFKNAGYSADDMFNMLANGVDAGTWSVDKLGDAVKEFNIRMSDGSAKDAVEALGFSWEKVSEDWSKGGDSAKEVFNMLFSELDGLENTTEGYGIGVGLLGTMYEDLGQDAILALSSTKGEISSTKNALDEINAVKYDDLGSAIEGIKRNLETSVAEPIKENVMPAVNEFIEDVDWQGVGDTIGEVFGVVVEGAIALVGAVKEAVQWMSEHKEVVAAVAAGVGILTTAITAYNVVQGIKSAMEAANVTTVWGLVSAHIAQAAAAMAAIAPYVLVVAAIAAVIAIIVLCVKHWDEIVAAVKRCWESICETLSVWGEWINTNVIQPIAEFFSGLWDSITEACAAAWEWIKDTTSDIWNGIKEALSSAWEGIRSAVSNAIEAVKTTVSNIWNSIKTTTSNIWNGIKTAISNAWNAIKTAVTTVVNAIKTTISNVWNAIKSATSTAFNAVKSVAASVWNSIKSAISNVVNGVKSTVSNVWNGIKSTTSSVFNSVKSTVTTVWNNIKNAIIKPIETAKSKIKGIVDSIKGFFSNMKISLPNIKLPHIKITGKLSLNPPEVPKLSIEWYKDGAIFTKPTIFPTASGFKGVGEAGAEAVLPIDKLEGYIANAIDKAQNVVNFDTLAAAIADLANRPVALNINGRQFAYATASDTDSVGGMRNTFKSRGLAVD